jgi:transcriptional regulator NrdR family protein
MDGDFIRRRHCLDCGHRWYTLQTAETLIEGCTLQWSKLTRTYTIK